jgi:hypothetical protein
VTTNLLLSRPKKAVKNFRDQRGPMEYWPGEDFDLFYDLLVIANAPGPAARLRLRLTLLMWTGVTLPVYALSELLWASHSKVSTRLDVVVDRLDERCSTIESGCRRAGDDALIEYMGRVFDLVSNVANSVGRKAARLVRG